LVISETFKLNLVLSQDLFYFFISDVMIRVIPVDVAQGTIQEPVNIRMSLAKTVHDFKQLVADRFCIPTSDNIRCVIERYYNTLKPLDLGHKTLQSEGFQKTNKVANLFCWILLPFCLMQVRRVDIIHLFEILSHYRLACTLQIVFVNEQ